MEEPKKYVEPEVPYDVFSTLMREYATKSARVEQFQSYKTGEGIRLPRFNSPTDGEIMRELQRQSKTNFTPRILSAYKDRCHITGARCKTSEAEREIEKLLQGRHGLAISETLDDALLHGSGYLFVSNGVFGRPVVRRMSPSSVVKRGWDGSVTAALLPMENGFALYSNGLYTFFSPKEHSTTANMANIQASSLYIDMSADAYSVSQEICDEIPIYEVSLPSGVIPQDAITLNEKANQELLFAGAISFTQSHKQILVSGYEFETDDDGNELPPVLPKNSSEIAFLSSELKVHQIGQSTTSDLRAAFLSSISSMASLCGVPHTLVVPSSASTAVDTSALEAAFLARLETLQRSLSVGIGEALTAILRLQGIEDSPLVLWRSQLPLTSGSLGDAVLKLQQAGIPLRKCLETVGNFSPAEARELAGDDDASTRQVLSVIAGLADDK